MKVAAGAFVHLETRLATVCKEWQRRRDCYGDGPGGANDEEGFAPGGLVAADGRLQDRWTVHELLLRRLDSVHCACALD